MEKPDEQELARRESEKKMWTEMNLRTLGSDLDSLNWPEYIEDTEDKEI